MSYSNGLLPSNTNNISTVKGPKGDDGQPGVGFLLTSSGDYDIDGKILFNARTNVDANEDDAYDTIKKDYQSVPNKGYLINHFLKRNKSGVFYDLRGFSIQNSEEFDPNSWNSKTLITKGYADMKDNLKADKADLDNKADLISQDEQSFNAPISVPNYDQNTTKSSHIVNKKHLESTYLNKLDGDVLQNSLSFNMFLPDSKRQIYNIGTPLSSHSVTNKIYVDSLLHFKSDINKTMLLNGTQIMKSDMNLGGHRITNLQDPNTDSDGCNKRYVDKHITNNIQSSNDNNAFKYIMQDPSGQISEENDVKLYGTQEYQPSPHQINKTVVNMQLILDSEKRFFSLRIGLNLYPLSNSNYTLCFELLWPSADVETVWMNAISSIETVHNVFKKTFLSQKYAKLICQFNKSQSIGNNYLLMVWKLN